MSFILVTGAAGQVGAATVRLLLSSGYRVRAAVRSGSHNRLDGLEEHVEMAVGDLRDEAFIEKIVAGVDGIVHTAAWVGRPAGVSEADYFDNNLRPTFLLAAAAGRRADAIRNFVYLSSSSVYPNDSHAATCAYHPVDEKHPLLYRGTYAVAKAAGENILQAAARETGLRFSILRPPGIVSGDAILNRWTVGFVATILRIGMTTPGSEMYLGQGAGEPWQELLAQWPADAPCAVTGPDGRPWVYQLVDARDVAAGCLCALEASNAVGEVFNISAPRPIEYPEAAARLAAATGRPAVDYRAPVRWIYDLDNRKAKALIGYCPRWDIAEMIADAVAGSRRC